MSKYVKKVSIEQGIDGETQESCFMNSTLQTCKTGEGDVEVSIAVYIRPPDMMNEHQLVQWIDAGLCLLPEGFRAEVQISNPQEA